MLRSLLIGLALLVASSAAAAQDDEDRYLRRGVFVDGAVWLLTDAGSLFRIEERTRRRTDEVLPERVLDICRQDGEVLAVTGERYDGRSWTVRRRRRGIWRIVGRVPRQDDLFQAIDCREGQITVLTTHRLIRIGDDGPAAIPLSEQPLYARVNVAVLGTPDHLYVGLNSGEWGGGLKRIDRRSGRVVTLERNATSDRCHGGPLNTACDPVHAIAPIPWRPDCVAIAVGLVHFFSHGRLAEICGERVETFYSTEIPLDLGGDSEGVEAVTTSAAFFGLVESGRTLRAAGLDGIYRIGAEGLIDIAPYPEFREVRGVRLNFDLPDVILVVTRINRRASVRGAAPLMVPR